MQATEFTKNTEMVQVTRIFSITERVRAIFAIADGFISVDSVFSVANCFFKMTHLRKMTLADLDEIMRIEQRVHRNPWTRGNFTDALDSGYVCKVYEAEGEMLGYTVLMPAVDEAQLLNISIAAEHQRKGLGRKLLGETKEIAHSLNMRRLLLEVRPSNVAALGLYRDAGFREIGLRRGYYAAAGGREDAIVMECLL